MSSRFPYSPFGSSLESDPFALLHDEMDRLFGRTLQRFGMAPFGAGGTSPRTGPRMDVTETDRALCIELDMPGVAREDLELSIDGALLTVRGRRRPAQRDTGEQPTVLLSERPSGEFERAVRLPFEIRMAQCAASLRDGVLTVTLDKSPGQRRARRIEIRAARDEAGSGTRTELEHGQQEVLDAEKPSARRESRAGKRPAEQEPERQRAQGDEPPLQNGQQRQQGEPPWQEGEPRTH